ncbi:hypothetical protein [Crocosphaera watsonii]|uniref:hypothetical protein n=1 Tax=Crocosphaera watsonii TaxID=263511 RepID=UPI0030D7061A
MDKKEPSPLVEAGIEHQACLGLSRFHEAEESLLGRGNYPLSIVHCPLLNARNS